MHLNKIRKFAILAKNILRKKSVNVFLGILLICLITLPVKAQAFVFPDLINTNNWLPQSEKNAEVSVCIRLDGICLFQVTSQLENVSERVSLIQDRLKEISHLYFSQEDPEAIIERKTINNLPNINVTIDGQEIRLMTVTTLDVKNEGVDIATKANFIIEQLEQGLKRGKKERESIYLIKRGLISAAIVGLLLIINSLLSRLIKQLSSSKDRVSKYRSSQPISTLLIRREQWNIKEVQYRLLQITQGGIWLAGILIMIGLFPYTRIGKIWLIAFLRIPIRIGIVSLVTYLVIRISYAFIDKFSSILFNQDLLAKVESDQRLHLRLTTISLVARSIITIILMVIGIIVALSAIGINIAPLLAGVGILGVGVSLASQNLIRDAINGFFIIIEDQYAIGDVIEVGAFSGLVENINLRITQLRDPAGRLVTVPNSEVRIVANLSSKWSRADLMIPVAYETDIDQALKVVCEVAQEMTQDKFWKTDILDNPEILGVDNFEEWGLIIRVWIKTRPLKQWNVSREFRRRLKVAFDSQGLPLPIRQQKLWLTHDSSDKNSRPPA
ncbi:MAG: mechanosensitive ion channel family protein [cyanobacterium endosymbiont of Rhopalodia musculus]|uniref:mechanosensitive ion channel family protein n=1 Tax=cyanobacterium endosymbiont of Epithemia clementina EcSB TaxID=3034674 RepID=UPI00247FB1BE|nr:mechanosensitive ion channel family protein [cyanobacterium endosymbiont of Epithemia clementina EcSB]WGT66848.1 mechanosensitive ion channel family protein [cyanobacterium endosymbiont of Epithemia clementina EcSB]